MTEEEELFSEHEFATITAAPPKEGEDDPLPQYSDKGRILVRVLGRSESRYERYELEVLAYETDSSVFWIQEGVGVDYWVDTHIEFPTIPGVYVIEGIHGYYYKGSWSYDDDWEEWEWDAIRPATAEEIAQEALF